jgi:hypothetical protein
MTDEKEKAWSILAQVYTRGKAWIKSFWVYDPKTGWILTDDWNGVPASVYMTYATAKNQFFAAQISAPDGIDYRTLNIYG